MRVRSIFLALLSFLSFPVYATTLHFSNCPHVSSGSSTGTACDHNEEKVSLGVTDGACLDDTSADGTSDNPYCLDPNSLGKNTSFAQTFGGFPVADDVIALCHGACDGIGTGRFYFKNSASTTAFIPPASGTSGHPITVRPFCNEAGQCEGPIIISGDSNGDGVWESGEMAYFLDNTGGKDYWTFEGWPNGGGTDGPDLLAIERFGNSGGNTDGRAFNLEAGGTGWDIDNVEIRYMGHNAWNQPASVIDNVSNCTQDGGPYVIRVWMNVGTVLVRNGKVHSTCGSAFRYNTNTSSELLIENEKVYNNDAFSYGIFDSTNVTIRGNEVWDNVYGIAIEDRVKTAVVEDNDVSCRGQYHVRDQGGDNACSSLIVVSDGDNNVVQTFGQSEDITVRRNIVWASGGSGVTAGRSGSGISVTADCAVASQCIGADDPWDCCTGAGAGAGCAAVCDYATANYVVENNIVYGIQAGYGGDAGGAVGIKIESNVPVTVQNNTIYYSAIGLQLDGPPWGQATAHVAKNNLVVRSFDVEDNSDTEEVRVCLAGVGSSVTYNDFSDPNGHAVTRTCTVRHNNSDCLGSNNPWPCCDSGVGNGKCSCGASICAGTTNLCAAVPGSFGSNNICQVPIFQTCDSSTYCTPGTVTNNRISWDFHLTDPQACIDAGTTGASDDIDKDTRPFNVAPDIGADERWWLIYRVPPPHPSPDPVPPIGIGPG